MALQGRWVAAVNQHVLGARAALVLHAFGTIKFQMCCMIGASLCSFGFLAPVHCNKLQSSFWGLSLQVLNDFNTKVVDIRGDYEDESYKWGSILYKV
jgi:hypothetical protein